MIVDSSALIAVIFKEPRAPEVIRELGRSASSRIGSPILFETSMVERGRRGGRTQALEFVTAFEIEEVAFGPAHRAVAEEAFAAFGKGRSPARLNFADCMAYAFAKVDGEPMLTLDEGFAKTDLELVPLD